MKRNTWIALAAGGVLTAALLAWTMAPQPVEVEAVAATRGRFETAIALWNQGTFRPGNDREVHLVSELFLAAGRPREALAILASNESLCRSSHLLSLDRVQAHLLRGEQDTAREWSDIHLAAAPDGRSRIRRPTLFSSSLRRLLHRARASSPSRVAASSSSPAVSAVVPR